MRSQEELQEALKTHPNDFDVLYEFALLLAQKNELKFSFAIAERALSAYEADPKEADQERYKELKVFRKQLFKDHLDALLEDTYPLLDPRWPPVFKLSRPKELAWKLNGQNIQHLQRAIRSDQLKRLGFLNITIDDSADNILRILKNLNFSPIKILSICFFEDPSIEVYWEFWEAAKYSIDNVTSFSVRMPHLTDKHAILSRKYFKHLDNFGVLSFDRSTMTQAICEYLADDEKSNSLTTLGIVGSSIGDQGLMTLMQSENFSKLQSLDLHDGILTNASARLIDADFTLPRLKTIDLRYNQIDPAGIDRLSKSRYEFKLSDQHTRPAGRI